VASPLFTVDGEIRWQERLAESGTCHPDFVRYAAVLNNLKGSRAERASQFFNACLVHGLPVEKPEELEAVIDGCVNLLKLRRLA